MPVVPNSSLEQIVATLVAAAPLPPTEQLSMDTASSQEFTPEDASEQPTASSSNEPPAHPVSSNATPSNGEKRSPAHNQATSHGGDQDGGVPALGGSEVEPGAPTRSPLHSSSLPGHSTAGPPLPPAPLANYTYPPQNYPPQNYPYPQQDHYYSHPYFIQTATATTTTTTTTGRDPVISAMAQRLEQLENELAALKLNASTVPPPRNHDHNDDRNRDQAALLETTTTFQSRKSTRNDDVKEEIGALLPEDTFSLFVFSRQWTTLGMAVGVSLFQLATLGLLIANVIDMQKTIFDDPDDYEPDNPLGIPEAVPPEVVIAQLFALLIVLMSEDNISWAMNIFVNGYNQTLVRQVLRAGWQLNVDATRNSEENGSENEEVDSTVGKKQEALFPNLVMEAPWNLGFRWRLSSISRFLVGCLSLAATFMLIVRSETVLDVLLNFTAIEFISRIDNGAFALAKWGYFGDQVKRDADHLICSDGEFTLRDTLHCRADFHFIGSIIVRVLLVTLPIGFWAWVLWKQNRGDYLNKEIYAQMGDPSNLSLGTYSGVYVRTNERQLHTRRFAWVAKVGRGELTYCSSALAWIFRDTEVGGDNECNWILKSEQSESFNVLGTADANWVLREEFNIEVPAEKMLLVAYNSANKPGGRRCELTTTYGLNCEYQNVCPMLTFDQRRPPFAADRAIPTEFKIIEDLHVYDRPVYVGKTTENEALHVIMYTGRRWILASTIHWVDIGMPFLDEDGLASMLEDFRVHTFTQKLGVAFISAPVDVGTSENTATPEGLEWFYAEDEKDSDIGKLVNVDSGRITSSTLLCAICDSNNPCFSNAPCVDDQCVCDLGGSGTRCEVPPTGNGFCNTNFNNGEFSFDGGDCCMTSCQNSPIFSCGKTTDGFNDIRNVECSPRQDSVGWGIIGGSVLSPFTASPEFGAAVFITSEGTGLLVGAPGGDGSVSLLRLDGSVWVPDSADLQIDFVDEGFGRDLVVSERIPRSISNIFQSRQLLVVASSQDETTTWLYAYNCASGACRVASFLERDELEDPIGTGVFFYSTTAGIPRQNLTEFQFISLERLTAVDVPFPCAISPDGNYLCQGGRLLTVSEWVDEVDSWVELFTLNFLENADGRVGMVQYVDISSAQPTTGNDEFIIVVGLKRYLSDQGDDSTLIEESPLEVRVFRWVVGSEPHQLGVDFTSDYHLVFDLARSLERPDEPRIPLKYSVHLSEDGKVLVHSSYFLQSESPLTFDDIDPLKSTPSDSLLLEYDSLLEAVVFVRFWDGIEWTLRHKFVLGPKQDPALREGWLTSLSSDGSTIAIGTSANTTLYNWNGTVYVEEVSIDGGRLSSLAVSGDGSAVAIGNAAAGVSGTVDVYQNDRYTPCTAESNKVMHLSFTTGDATALTLWRVVQKNSNNKTLREGGPFGLDLSEPPNNLTFVYKECVDECSSMSVASVSASPFDEGTFAAYFRGEKMALSTEVVEDAPLDCELLLLWSGP